MRTRFDPDELAAHADAVRALAARLVAQDGVADPATADDVVQAACVAAIQRPPRDEVPRRAWFVRVTRNLALRARRDRVRRERRERAAGEAASRAATSAPAAAEVAERLEGHRRLVDAVAALEEPYRSAIVLRFFEGLAPPEIAARLGLPLGTVHTHVHRGVARLRERLAPDGDGGRGRAMLVLLAAPPGGAGPRPGAPRPAPPAIPHVPTLAPTAGVAVMAANKLVASAALVALALFVGWMAVDAQRSAGRETRTARSTAAAVAAQRAARTVAAPAPQTERELPPPVDFATIDRDLDLHGRVVDGAGSPVAGAEATTFTRPWTRTRTLAVGERTEEVPGAATRTAADGTFRIRLARGTRTDLRVRAAGYAETVRTRCQAGERIEVVLAPAVAVVVTVTDVRGDPVEGADVSLVREGEPDPAAPRVDAKATTAADGTCRLCGLPPGGPGCMFQVASARGTFWDVAFALPASGERRVDVRLRTTRTIRGVVKDADSGSPIAGARVANSWTLRGGATSDAQGAYELPANDDDFAVYASAEGFADGAARLSGGERADIALRRAAHVTGRTVDVAGRPLGGVRIAVCGGDSADGVRTRASGVSGADGRFELGGLRPADPFVLILLAAGHGRTLLDVDAVGAPGGARDLGDVPLAPSRRLAGRVLLPDGSPAAGAVVRLTGANADRSRLRPDAGPADGAVYGDDESARTDDLGRFAFADLPPGEFQLQTVLPGRKNALASAEIGASDVDGLELRFTGGHRLAVRVVDSDGAPFASAPVQAWTADRWSLSYVTGPDGAIVFDADSPVTSVRAGPSWSRLAAFVAGDTVRVAPDATEVELRVRRAGWARGRVLAPDGSPLQATIQVLEDGKALWQESPFEPLAYARETGAFAALVPLGAKVSLVLRNAVLPATTGGRARALVGRIDDVEAGAEDLVLRASFTDAGRALDVVVEGPDGISEPGAKVHATLRGGARLPDAAASRTGRARFDDLDAASVTLWAELPADHPSHDLWVPPSTTVVPEGQEVTLRFREGAPVRGVVQDAAGKPVSGAVVTLYAAEGSAQLATRTTGSAGRFAFAVAPDAKRPLYLYIYKLPADGNAAATEFRDPAFEPGDADLTLKLAPPSR